jgi:pimeloyl-ACP methyl ester carboxylesterase
MTPASAWMIAHSGIVMPAARPEVLLPALREFRTHDWRWYFTLALGAADHHRMDLSFVGAPTTIVAGKWDVLTSKEDMLEAAAEIPHSKVEVLPGSHFLPLEFPDEIGLLLWELLGRTELATVARAV